MVKIAERLQTLRKENKITQKSVANYLGIKLRTYQYYEGNDHRPDYETLIALADYFHVTTDYLLGRTDQR
ncbi:helix-turn-helix domain-containing protein [uncultured Dysosmobacter sp.]|uniref:helix-turn-helix domain-containing protein n=1 Tax=uncultured Dysosmobacter sp. TaxID=2591384 RepID=UPI002636AC3F|nr:helix-turn-helix transcriptional regulator [uncultured Dysosmobacter sp.]